MKIEFTPKEIKEAAQAASDNQSLFLSSLQREPAKVSEQVNTLMTLFIEGNDISSIVGEKGMEVIYSLLTSFNSKVNVALKKEVARVTKSKSTVS